MLDLDKLLAPVRDDAPAGDDPSASGVLFELETLAQGKPETQFSAAEEPDWKAVRKRCLEVLETTRDFRVAAILTAALLRLEGVAGLRDGLSLIRGYADRLWESVFPLLDASDDNDPSERINALSSLAAPLGADGDVLRVVPTLRNHPVLAAPRAGRFGVVHYLAAIDREPWPYTDQAKPEKALLEAAVKEVDPAVVAATVATAVEARDLLVEIEKVFKAKAGPASFPSFEPLKKDLKTIEEWLAVVVAPVDAAAPAGEGGVAAAPGAPVAGSGSGFSGSVRNRDEAVRAMDAIIAYYRAAEPSSPVPFLLKRAKRLATMDFLQITMELTPDARERILLATGPVDEATP